MKYTIQIRFFTRKASLNKKVQKFCKKRGKKQKQDTMLSHFPQFLDSDGLAIFAKPLATEKLTKKICKLLSFVKEDRKKHCVLGIKPCAKAIQREKKKGIMILCGDVRQADMIAHLPILCEEYSIPYVWVSRRTSICDEETGLRSKSVPSCILILKDNLGEKQAKKFDVLSKKIRKLPTESSDEGIVNSLFAPLRVGKNLLYELVPFFICIFVYSFENFFFNKLSKIFNEILELIFLVVHYHFKTLKNNYKTASVPFSLKEAKYQIFLDIYFLYQRKGLVVHVPLRNKKM
ncbi:hypothetical protein RFI_00058 [Reticulomyxa filosa]|uniref:Ribosomal protein eL8/eL30/eS12/Gadd45 domain-containing protein n=1 Tax=Reticulomyxa filosa TaxID=46433 RepID=X6PH34_RETFI|nr:hypothetical protein RFI_00058 [Reticulomyxa filosa]|eukprot:ETO37002.1 hypothetical protein RFI_00058 [Reticulomyxa filosa]